MDFKIKTNFNFKNTNVTSIDKNILLESLTDYIA